MEIGSSPALGMIRHMRLSASLQARSIERLSASLRVNRAADDAASLAIAEGLTSRLRGTHQAIRNVQDGIHMLRVADGAFGAQITALQRMRELAVQAANGALSAENRLGLQAEIDALKAAIDQNAATAAFNGQPLLTVKDAAAAGTARGAIPWRLRGGPGDPYSAGVWNNATYRRDAESRVIAAGGALQGVTLEEIEALKARMPSLMEGAMRKAEASLISLGLDPAASPTTLNVQFVIDQRAGRRNMFYATDNTGSQLVINLYPHLGDGVPAPSATQPPVTLEQAIVMGVADTLLRRLDRYAGAATDADATDARSLLQYNRNPYRMLRHAFATGAAEAHLAYGKPANFRITNGGSLVVQQQHAAWLYRFVLENHGQEAASEMARMVLEDPDAGVSTGHRDAIANRLHDYLLDLTDPEDGAAWTTNRFNNLVKAWIAAQPVPAFAQPIEGLARTTDTRARRLDEPMQLQVGAGAGETMEVQLFAGGLGHLDFASMVTVTDADAASRSLATLDRALLQALDARSRLGASENRLHFTLNNLQAMAATGAAALSHLRDADLAAEATRLSRAQILSQSSREALAQLHRMQHLRVKALLYDA